jgi:hypothetical protein
MNDTQQLILDDRSSLERRLQDGPDKKAIGAFFSVVLGVTYGATARILSGDNIHNVIGFSCIQGLVFSHCTLADRYGYAINMVMAEAGYDYGVALAEYFLKMT